MTIMVLLFVAVMVATLLFSLLTGKALSPVRGLKPEVVTRWDHPRRYWVVVALLAALLALALWLQSLRAG